MVKFGYAIHYVSDVESALRFFEKAFGLTRRFMTDEKDYGELETGDTVLAFASHTLGESNLPDGYVSATDSAQPLGVEIALVTDQVHAAHKRAIENGATELKAPETKPWGQTVSYLRCPSGLLLELCTPMNT
ncbi:MAG: VOC family protein [Pseudomonadota bacterium]|nr:VOC family protein [Pseudomonadota bacterium]